MTHFHPYLLITGGHPVYGILLGVLYTWFFYRLFFDVLDLFFFVFNKKYSDSDNG
jgi:hypothetical protein